MKLWAKSLRARLVGYFALLSLLMTSGVGAIAFLYAKVNLLDLIYQQLETTATLTEKNLHNWIEDQKKTLVFLAESEQIKESVKILLNKSKLTLKYQSNYQQLTQDINLVLAGKLDIKEVFIINLQGKIIFSNKLENQGITVKDQAYFSPKNDWKNLYFLLNDKKAKILITTPLINEKGEPMAVLAMELNLDEINELIFDNVGLGGEAYLIDKFGFLVFRKNRVQEKWQDKENFKSVLKAKNGQGIYKNYQNNLVIGIYHYLTKIQLGLIVEIPHKEALLPAQKLAKNIILICLFMSGLTTAVFYLIVQQITKPLFAIKDTALKVIEGDRKAIAPILSEDEVGILAYTFNEIMAEFNSRYQDFKEQVTQLEIAEITAVYTYQELEKEKKKVELVSNQLTQANDEINLLNDKLKSENLGLTVELQVINQRLTQFLDAIPVGVIVFDLHVQVYYANHKAKELLGENLQFKEDLYLTNTLEKYPADQIMGVQSLKLGKVAHADNIELHQGDKIIPLESWETPIFNDLGSIDYGIVAFQDISERRKIERERQNFTQKILKLNQANERFVPREFLQLLNKNSITEVELGDNIEREMTVLFSDIRDFTKLSENMNPTDNFRFINAFLSRLSPSITKYHGFIDKYIGDSIMALFVGNADEAVNAAISMLQRLKKYNITRQRPERRPIKIGIGINTGLMMLGTVGSKHRMDGTVISDAVNLAARLETLTKDYSVPLLISQNTFLRLEDSGKYCLRLVDRVTVKGKSIPVAVYEVFDADDLPIKEGKLATKTLFEQGISLYHLGHYKQAQLNFHQCLKLNSEDKLSQIYLQRCSTLF